MLLVCELLPFCAFSFVCDTQSYQVRWLPVTIYYDRCRNNLQNKMAVPKASVHPVKIRLCYHFAIYPTNKSCSQRCSRRIMLLRTKLKSCLRVTDQNVEAKWLFHGIIGIHFRYDKHTNIYRNSINAIPQYNYIPVYRPPLVINTCYALKNTY